MVDTVLREIAAFTKTLSKSANLQELGLSFTNHKTYWNRHNSHVCITIWNHLYRSSVFFSKVDISRSTYRVVPDWGSAKVDTFWKFVKNLICFRIFHQKDVPKRISRYQKWVPQKFCVFQCRGMSLNSIWASRTIDFHQNPALSPGSGPFWGLPTKGIT